MDKSILTERVGRLSAAKLELVLAGIDTVLGPPPLYEARDYLESTLDLSRSRRRMVAQVATDG